MGDLHHILLPTISKRPNLVVLKENWRMKCQIVKVVVMDQLSRRSFSSSPYCHHSILAQCVLKRRNIIVSEISAYTILYFSQNLMVTKFTAWSPFFAKILLLAGDPTGHIVPTCHHNFHICDGWWPTSKFGNCYMLNAGAYPFERVIRNVNIHGIK